MPFRSETLDLSRGYVTPFLDWPGRLTLGKASRQEEARLSQDYRDSTTPRNGNPVHGNHLAICLLSSRKNGTSLPGVLVA